MLPILAAAGATCSLVRHNRMDRLDHAVATLSRRHARVWYLVQIFSARERTTSRNLTRTFLLSLYKKRRTDKAT